MKRVALFTLGTALVAVACLCRWHTGEGAPGGGPAAVTPRTLPPLIIPNVGQWPADVAFVARVGGRATEFRPDGIRVGSGAGAGLSLGFTGASADVRLQGEGPQPGRVHYLIGNDPAAWVRDVPTYAGLRYGGLYDGIDLTVHVRDGGLEYDLLIAPGTELDDVAIRCDGARGLSLDDEGALRIETADGALRQRVVAAWQADDEGGTEPVACSFRLLADAGGSPCFGFSCPGRDRQRALVVDPTLEYSTFLGGSSGEALLGATVDGAGHVFVAGTTGSAGFPVTAGAYSESMQGTSDGYVAELRADGGGLIYATFIGGTAPDTLNDIALDASGAAYVCGTTFSPDFPVTAGASQPEKAGSADAFAFKLDPTGSTLLYSTFFGGHLGETGLAIGVAPDGEACVVGSSYSTDLPVTAGAFDTTYNGAYPTTDAFLLRLSADGSSRVFATYLGSSNWDSAAAVAVDDEGFTYITGYSQGTDFPTTPGALQPTMAGGSHDVFVTKFSPAGQQVWGTYLGGSINSDDGWGIGVDVTHAVYVTGGTASADFPVTQGAFDTSYGDSQDIFATKLLPEGRAIAWSTYLHTTAGGEIGSGIVADRAGAATLYSKVNYPGYPTTPDAYQPSWSGDLFTADAVLTKLHVTGQSLEYSTHFEGTSGENPGGIALDGQGGTYLAGSTESSDLPVTAGAFDQAFGGPNEAFIAKFDIPIGPWTLLSGGSHGSVDVPGLVGFGPLTDGSSNGLAVRGALPGAGGVLVAGFSALNQPFAGGVLVPTPDILVSVATTPLGRIDLGFTWPSGVPSGLSLYVQAWIFDPAGVGGKSASNGVVGVTP